MACVHTLALPVRVSEIHLWTQAESVNKCKGVVFQRIAKFIPLIMASSSVKLIRWESFSGRNQTSLIMVLRGASSILSSHPAVTSDALHLMNATAT